MTPDLFSSPAEPEAPENYATRKIRQWLLADPLLLEGCRAIARRGRGVDRLPIVSEQLRRFIAQTGRDDEPPGLFLDLLDDGLKEVNWSDLAAFFREMIEG